MISKETPNENPQGNEEEVQDKFSQMMFGTKKIAKNEPKSPASLASQDHEIHLTQLMSQLDDIYTSIQDLKPVINELSPIIEFLKKRLKL